MIWLVISLYVALGFAWAVFWNKDFRMAHRNRQLSWARSAAWCVLLSPVWLLVLVTLATAARSYLMILGDAAMWPGDRGD